MKIYRKIVTASLSTHVKGFPYQEFPDLSDLLSVSYATLNGFAKELQSFMSEKEFEGFWKGYMTITPDGDYHDKKEGIMNLYLNGAKPEHVQKIIAAAIQELNRQIGVKASFIRSDDIKNGVPRVARIKVSTESVGSDKMPPEINMANDNAFFIFQRILGYQQNLWEDGEFDATELKTRIEYFLGENSFDKNDPKAIEQHRNKVNDGFRGKIPEDITGKQDDFGDFLSGKLGMSSYDDDMIRHRLQELLNICKWALDHGYKTIYLG